MTIPTNALVTYGIGSAGGLAEQVAKAMALIDPAETPFWSMLPKDTDNTQGRYFEWMVDALATPAANRQIEGDTKTAASVTAPSRLGNYMQISDKVYTLSRTVQQIKLHGRTKEMMRTRMNKGKELRRDIEIMLLSNTAQAAGSSISARITAGFPTFITNAVHVSTLPTGNGTDTYAATSDTSLTYEYLVSAHQLAYEDGGDPTVCMLSPTLKRKFSLLSIGSSTPSTADIRFNVTPGNSNTITALGTVDFWRSDFGNVEMIPNRIMSLDSTVNKSFFLIDKNHVSLAQLQAITVEPLAKVSDGDTEMIICEYGLKVSAPKAHAAGFNLTG